MNRAVKLSEVTIGMCVQLLQDYRDGVVGRDRRSPEIADWPLTDVNTALDELRSEKATKR